MNRFAIFLSLIAVLAICYETTGSDLPTKAILGFGGSVSDLIGYINKRNNAKLATQLDDHKDNFWYDALKNKREHYTPEYAQQLASRFDEIYAKDQNSILLDMLKRVRENIMQTGAKEFSKQVGGVNEALNSSPELNAIVKGFKVSATQNYDDELALELEKLLHEQAGSRQIETLSQYRQLFSDNNPCEPLKKLFADPALRDYQRYLELATDPIYWPLTPYDHAANARVLAACNRLASPEVISKAFEDFVGARS